jgi:hypothetical protein
VEGDIVGTVVEDIEDTVDYVEEDIEEDTVVVGIDLEDIVVVGILVVVLNKLKTIC